MNQIVKCEVCGAPYEFYNMTVADQSVCPECRHARRQAMENPTEDQQRERERKRRAAFG